MGPIQDNPREALRLSQILERLVDDKEMIKTLLEDAGSFTKSGKPVINNVTSGARFGDVSGLFKNASNDISGRTVKAATKSAQALSTEEAIIRAAIALNTPVGQPPTPPVRPNRIPLGATAGVLLNPFMALLAEAITRHEALNSNESAELDARRKLPPTIDE